MRPTRKVCNESQSSYKLAFNFRNLSVHPPRKYLKSASKAKISEHEISLVFPLTHPRSSLSVWLSVSSLVARGVPPAPAARYAKTTGYKSGVSILALLKHNVPLKSKIAQPPPAPPTPSIARTFDCVFIRTVGTLTQNEARPVAHVTFVSKRQSASQAKGFCDSFIQHVHRVHGLFLLYSLFCWSI